MRRLALAAAIIALSAPAYSQVKQPNDKTLLEIQEEERDRLRKDVDKDYDAAMKRSKGSAPATASDPWHNMRSNNSSGDKK